jgi:tubulin--tyrosine ligase
LFLNVCEYFKELKKDPFKVAIPLTFHVKSSSDPEFNRFEHVFKAANKGDLNIWIIKPGENTNRGCGI